MVNFVRQLVSKKKKRFVDTVNNFDLDLAYVTDNIIASGFPASGFESLYRNPMPEMKRFFETRHSGKYKLWALTAEPDRQYDKSVFHGRVEDSYQFFDHHAPPFDIVVPMCQTIHQWLTQDPKNVAVIHCKAGKGRTGVAICAYLLYSGQQPTADKALAFYAQRRTKNNKGVTIPSQCRTIQYLETVMKNANGDVSKLKTPFPNQKLRVKKTKMIPAPKSAVTIGFNLRNAAFEVIATNIVKAGNPQFKKSNPEDKEVVIPMDTLLQKDILFEFFDMKAGKEKKLFQFWINMEFISNNKAVLQKKELDKAYKDCAHNKKYAPNFYVEVEFEIGRAHV